MRQEIRFSVAGAPPLKGEAISLFSSRHKGHGAVLALLEAAGAAMTSTGLRPFAKGVRLGLEVIAETPGARMRGDATNYLGGIADVLEAKDRRERELKQSLRHLGTLRDVHLYGNDSQIRVVRYEERRGGERRYTVRIWDLSAEAR